MSAPDVIAVCAVAVSVLSLIVSIYALYIQRVHDRKSVQPIPQIVVGDYENKLYVAIENAGTGPFIIDTFHAVHVNSHVAKTSIVELLPSLPNSYYWSTFVERLEGRAIPAQEKLVILELDEQGDPTEFAAIRQKMRDAPGFIRLTIKGKDIYGNLLPNCERLLEYFHRMYMGYLNSPKKM
jgi:hypothetical protein